MSKYYVNTFNSSGTYPYDTIATAAKTFHELIAGIGGNLSDGDSVYVVRLLSGWTTVPVSETGTPTELLLRHLNNVSIIGCDAGGNILADGKFTAVLVDSASPLFNFYKCANISIQNIEFAKAYSDNSSFVKFDESYACTVSKCKFSYYEPWSPP